MKRRSHRFQSHHDPHDDWVDGSWTVDCICGVNFDDGEEMVNCDDCGVWVHTRCSRYVKGEELFTCDKCKAKSNRNDSEETEVAQLLVELPTKTIRLESDFVANGPPRRPFRLWTDIPMEERVHVQGIPGGDSALFKGFSSIFSPELWKCTGYVPKKFNFQYREFPCWEEDNNGDREGGKLNAVDKGAGVFFSLSKESVLATSAVALIGMRGKHGKEGCFDKKNEDVGHQQIGVKKERSLLRSVVVPSGKQREELGSSKDRSRKNRTGALDKEGDMSLKSLHASAESVFTSASDGKPVVFYEDRSSKSFMNDSQGTKNMNLMDASLQRCGSLEYDAVSSGAEKPKDSLEGSLEALSCDTSNVNLPVGFGSKERKHDPVAVPVVDSSAKVIASSALEHTRVGKLLVKLEGDGILNVNPDNNMEVSAASDLRPPNNKLPSAAEEVKMKQIDVSGGTYPSSSSVRPIIKVEVHDSDSRGVLNGILGQNMPENSKKNGVASSCLPDHREQESDKISEDVGDYHQDKYQELKNDFCQPKQEFDRAEGSRSMQTCTSEPKHSSGFSEELSASIGTNLTVPRLPSQQRIFSEKLSSTLSAVMTSKSSASENFKSADAVNSSPDTKQVVLHEFHTGLKKDRATIDLGALEDWHEKSIKTEKEHQKSCSASMVTNSGKMSHTYLPKQTVSDANDSLLHSSKASLVSVETVGSLQNECDSFVPNRAPSSTLPLRSEKLNHFANQSLSKPNHTVSMNLSATANSPAALSDEELALLLHQELNSSPRVPRVPRVRHAGSLPRLTSPTAISMLVKRTSGSGGKDYTLSSRRINRDAYKDGVCRTHERDVEDKKTGRVPLSPDWRRPDSGSSADISCKREGNSSPMSIHSIRKNVPTASTSTANSGPSSSTEVNDHRVSSLHNSPKTISDEETGTIGGPVHQTLPGLINEIMSKGKRMTYEELCNAVLPHWHNLRKHNGERYAYSSHSQAVLDCLRNRHEWARLVDRGPKTNTSRKRRKLDPEESDDNEYGDGRALKVRESKNLESQREDYPKGKRKARKRRLAPQGRGIKDVRKRRKLDSVTDDDIGPFSHSTEESLFSEDEIEGGGGGASVGMEASASLDDTGKTQL